jgi:prepilin-type N-terminal cleavage/methylation domain-containing protein/prepilin-type processing-associated H-X9-DG protein
MCKRRKGFTLVELVTVIAIGAFMIALLAPTVRQTHLAADSIVCTSNMEQIGQAMAAYAQDNNGYLIMSQPMRIPDPNDPNKKVGFAKWARWPTALVMGGYLEGKCEDEFFVHSPSRVFKCPADSTIPNNCMLGQGGHGNSYMVNNRVIPFNGDSGASGGPFNISKYKNRAARLVLAEKDGSVDKCQGGLIEHWNQDTIINHVKGRHGRAAPDSLCNVLFLDWHVEPWLAKEVIAPAVRAKQKNVNPDPKNLWGLRAED